MPDEVTSSGAGWVSVITPKKPLLHLPLREIWRYRDLITLMIWRDFISLHKQTVFGPLWYFVQPLVSTSRVPGGFRKNRANSHEQHPAIPFLYVGNCHLVLFLCLP